MLFKTLIICHAPYPKFRILSIAAKDKLLAFTCNSIIFLNLYLHNHVKINKHCYLFKSHAVLVVPYFVDAPIAVQNCSSVVSFLNDLVCMEHCFFFNTLSRS